MPELSLTNTVVTMAAAFLAPLLLGLAPRVRLPAVVLEILAGILIGPAGLGWVRVDLPIQILSTIGLAFLLLLAGLEVELDQLRASILGRTGLGFLLSFGLALVVSVGLAAAGLAETPLLVAIILSATSLGVLIPLLKDTGEIATPFGQLVLGAATVADVGTIILLSLLFSRQMASPLGQLVLIGGLVMLGLAVAFAVRGVERWRPISRALLRLQDTSAQIRVRGAFLLLLAFVALAQSLGLEILLGAFLAGVILKVVDRDAAMTHPALRRKLEAAGFGIFIPMFFLVSGLRFDARALVAGNPALVPLLLLALLVVRGLPALLYRPRIGGRRTVAAALLQATSLSFIVVAAQIGQELGLLGAATGAALVAAGLLSVMAFPALALVVLERGASAMSGEPRRGPAGVLTSRPTESPSA